jgi:CxxC motif-containing protein (DUF1111 family)
LLSLLVIANTTDDEYVALTLKREQYSGWAYCFNTSEEAFGFSAPNLTFDEQSDFGIGNSFLADKVGFLHPPLQLEMVLGPSFLMQ